MLFSMNYRYDFSAPELPGWEEVWARFPLLITAGNTTPEGIAHYQRIEAANDTQFQFAYLAANHSSAPYTIAGQVWESVANGRPFMYWADGHSPTDPDSGLALYDYRTAAWFTGFQEGIRAIASAGFRGVFIDNCNVWDAVLESGSEIVRRELYEALQDAIMVARGRYPTLLMIGNGEQRFAGLNGEMAENDPHRFKAVCRSFTGHQSPELNLCMLYSTVEINCKNAYNQVMKLDGGFGAQADCMSPQWFPWYTG